MSRSGGGGGKVREPMGGGAWMGLTTERLKVAGGMNPMEIQTAQTAGTREGGDSEEKGGTLLQ